MSSGQNYLNAKIIATILNEEVNKFEWKVKPAVDCSTITEENRQNLLINFGNKLSDIAENKNNANFTNNSFSVRSPLSDRLYDADNSGNTNPTSQNMTTIDDIDFDNTENYFADNSRSIYNFKLIDEELSCNISDVVLQTEREEIIKRNERLRKANETSSGIHSDYDEYYERYDGNSDGSSLQNVIPVFGDDSNSDYSNDTENHPHKTGYAVFEGNSKFYRICYDNQSQVTATSDASEVSLIDESYEFDVQSKKSLSWLNRGVHNSCSCSSCAEHESCCRSQHCEKSTLFNSSRDFHSFNSKSSMHAKFHSTPQPITRSNSHRSSSSSEICDDCIQIRSRKLSTMLHRKF